jgi:hypothetical protein
MSLTPENNLASAARTSALNGVEQRQNLVRILFIHRSLADVERCLHELKRLRFTVSSDVVLTSEQFAERLRLESYDTIVAEYPSPNWQATQALDILHRMNMDIPLVFLVHGLKREIAAELILKGIADCFDVDSIGHVPVSVRRALDEKVLRDQRNRAKKTCDARTPDIAPWSEIEATEFAAATTTEIFWK